MTVSNEAALGIFLTWQSQQHAEAAAGLAWDMMAKDDQLEEDLLLLNSFLDAELSCVRQASTRPREARWNEAPALLPTGVDSTSTLVCTLTLTHTEPDCPRVRQQGTLRGNLHKQARASA